MPINPNSLVWGFWPGRHTGAPNGHPPMGMHAVRLFDTVPGIWGNYSLEVYTGAISTTPWPINWVSVLGNLATGLDVVERELEVGIAGLQVADTE